MSIIFTFITLKIENRKMDKYLFLQFIKQLKNTHDLSEEKLQGTF